MRTTILIMLALVLGLALGYLVGQYRGGGRIHDLRGQDGSSIDFGSPAHAPAIRARPSTL